MIRAYTGIEASGSVDEAISLLLTSTLFAVIRSLPSLTEGRREVTARICASWCCT